MKKKKGGRKGKEMKGRKVKGKKRKKGKKKLLNFKTYFVLPSP